MMKRVCRTLIILYILLCLTGCGTEKKTSGEAIELLEPVNGSVTSEAAAYRNLFDADTYSSAVLSETVEYSFAQNAAVESFYKFPGEKVHEGDILVVSDLESIDEDIENLEEQIASMEEEYLEYCQDIKEELADLEELVGSQESTVEEMEESDPEYNRYLGIYRKTDLNIMMKEAALQQKTELYELDHAYYLEKLQALREQRSLCILQAKEPGEVVAVGLEQYEDLKVSAEAPVIAIGNPERKILKCTYVTKSEVESAQEVYAFINGKRYDIEYQPMETAEYLRLKNNGDDIYSTFVLKDDGDEVELGAYAVIVIVNQKRTNILTVPKAAVNRENRTRFVYVVENGETVRRDIETGMTDGVYTEVLSGLEAGEQVMVDELMKHGEAEVVLEQGESSQYFEENGVMYYPSVTNIENPVSYGTAFYVDTHVELYQRVEKGQVIATVRVEADEIAIQRNQLKLQRLNERLQDLVDEGKPEENADAIEEKQEAISELQELLQEMQEDAATTEIVAPKSGIVVDLESFSKDTVLAKECLLARIADENTCYLVVKNTNQQLQYGKETEIIYKDYNRQECRVSGKVASLSQVGLSKSLQSEYSYVLLPPESVSAMAAVSTDDNKVARSRYRVSANVKEMKNIVLVPREAVTELQGQTYVHIIDANGEIKAQSFLAGGFDKSYYWVLDGLKEGIKICLE